MGLLTTLRRRGGVALGGASFADINNDLTNNFGPDGMTWAQAWPVTNDEFGKMVMACQRTGGGIEYLYSNDDGLTWVANTGITGNGGTGSNEAFITRSALAWDPVNNHLWALHVTTNGGDGGAFLRRYTIARDGSNNITGIGRDYSASCVLEDDLNASCRQPILFYVAATSKLIALWAIGDADSVEVHGATRVLAGSAADLTAANWLRLDGTTGDDASTITSTKSGNISVLTASFATYITPAAALIRNGPNAGDLALFYQEANTAGKLWYRRFNLASGNYGSPTTALDLGNVVRAGSTTIRQLYEVLAKPVEDASGNLYIGYANWKSNALGDTWSVAKVTTGDALGGTLDAYSAGGIFQPALYALTGDVAYDAASGLLVVTWVTTGGVGLNDGVARLYTTGLAPSGPEYVFFTADDVDIPLIYQDHATGDTRVQGGGKLLILFRDTRNQAPPYHGWAGTITIG